MIVVLGLVATGLVSFYRPTLAQAPLAPSVSVTPLPPPCRVEGTPSPQALSPCVQHHGPHTQPEAATAHPLRRGLTLTLDNPSPHPLDTWLDLGVPDALNLRVDIAGHPPLLVQNSLTPFEQRPLPHPHLLVPLTLPPGTTQVSADYTLHVNGKLMPVLHTPAGLVRDSTVHDLVNGLILGVMLTLLAVSATYSWATRQRAYRLYPPLIVAEVLMLMQTEGYAFAHLWPHAPQWNAVAPLVLASAVLALHALFAMEFLQLRQRQPLLHRLHQGLLAALGLNLLWMPGLGFEWGVIGLSALYCPLAFYTGVHALRDRVPGAPLYVLGMAWLFLFGIVLFGLGVMGLNPMAGVNHFHYPKFGLLIEALCFSAALINRVRLVQAQQTEQRTRRLAEAQELLAAEQARRQADARTREKTLQLAGASHDLSQPLASLRFAAEALKAQAPNDPIAGHLERTLAHAQSLLHSLMDDSRDDLHALSDRLDLAPLLPQWLQDHQAMAQSRRVRLRHAPARLSVTGSELVLARIVHNLLGNAVRHSGRGGRVLLGVRRRPGGVELQVLDTGPGLSAAQIDRLQQPFVQGDGATEGHGLGLHIVRSLCAQAGYRLSVRSQPGRGSCFAVFIPHEADTD
jgi:signal transduction histidine kinase